ncbi:hypothetical protein [Maridesulfovibrio sp.]|uniref:hypothetical protein n=1 Tax=Maridesulfovibrio sp. TaxID=2795000 RepID=UPI0029F54650|nr:hypothetical protein [Maridesulfovibrio sp.]
MAAKLKKYILLVIGLIVFAALGTGVILYSGPSAPPKPVLSSGYKFFKGISPVKLGFSNGEVISLNRTFWKHRDVVKKAILTVSGQDLDQGPEVITPKSGLKFYLQLEGKTGMTYAPEKVCCSRGSLVEKIERHLAEGARVLAIYENQSEFNNRNVEIIDM